MIEIKDVENESFSSVEALLNRTVENIETIGRPVWVTIDGTRYFVSYNEKVFSIINEDEDYVVILNPDGSIKAFIEDLNQFNIYNEAEMNRVVKVDRHKDIREQLYYYLNTPEGELPFIRYEQITNSNNNLILYDYVIPNENYNLYLNYIGDRNPDSIRYIPGKRRFGFEMSQDFITDPEYDDSYASCFDFINRIFKVRLAHPTKRVLKDDLLYAFQTIGFSKRINPELISILNGSSEKVRKLGTISKAYKSHLSI